MDWIKVLNRHILFEYDDLRDSEFVAWIKIMALTAYLEHIPTHDQMLKHVHYKTLTSLQDKLNKHSIDLQYILNKVLIDAQYVHNRRETWKKNKQQYRDDKKNVSMDVSMDVSSIDKDKDKDKDKEHIKTTIPKKTGIVYADDFIKFWDAYPKKVGKDAAYKSWKPRNGTMPPISDLLVAIGKQIKSDQWQKENGQYIPNPATWLNQGRWADSVETIKTNIFSTPRSSYGRTDANKFSNPRALSDETERELERIAAEYAINKAEYEKKQAARRQATGDAEGNDVPHFGN